MQSRYLAATAIAVLLVASHARAEAPANGVLVYPPSFFADARPNTAYDMIGRLPGFTFSDVGSARGFAGTAGNVLIDGQRPTSKTDSLESVLKRILAADIDHIELIRGGAPGIDMQGQTVVANVVLKKQDSTRFVATAEDLVFLDGHMIPYGALQFTRHTDGSIYEGSISSIQNYDDSVGHGKHFVFDGLGNLIQNDEAISHGLGIGFAAKGSATVPLWGGEFRANFTYQNSPFVDRLSYAHPGFLELFKDNSRDNNGELGLHWKGPVGPVELETLALQRLGHNNSSSDADDGVTLQHFTSAAATGETIARATVRYLPSPGLTIEGGAEGAYNYLDGKTAFFINGVDQPLPSATARVEERRGEVFFQGTWRFDPDWVLEAGARAEFSTISESGSVSLSRSFFYPKPRVLLAWTPAKQTQVRLRAERVLGPLDFGNFVASSNLSAYGVSAGNPNLAPDRHWQYELSFEQDFWDRGALVLTLTHEDISGVLDYIPVAGSSGMFDAPGNIGGGHKNQIDAELTLPLDRLGLPGGLLKAKNIWRFSGVRDSVTGDERVIAGVRPNDIELTLTQDIESLKSTWSIFFFDGWDERYYRLAYERHSYVPAPYFEVEWDYKPTPGWMFSFAVKNPVRFSYVDINTFYAGPRDLYGPDEIDTLRLKSQPRAYIEIRKTF